MNTPKSCATCDKADTAWRGEDLVLECHLNPPMTMPPPPEMPEATVSLEGLDDEEAEVAEMTLMAYAEPHRYPVVTDTDWCSWWSARSDS